MTDPQQRTNAELFAQFATALKELRARDVLRTNNPPAGDYAEWLAHRALGGVLAPPAEKSFDITMEDATRVQVKARTVSPKVKPGQLETSVFRSWDFEQAVFVQFAEADYSIVRAAMVPVEQIKLIARWADHVNGWRVSMKPALMAASGSVDLTEALRTAALLTTADIERQERPRDVQEEVAEDSAGKFIVTTPDGESAPLPKRHAVLALVRALSEELSCANLQGLLSRATFVRVDGELTGDALWDAMSSQLDLDGDKRKLWFVDSPIHEDGSTWVLAANVWGRRAEARMDKLVQAGSGLVTVRRADDEQDD
ncbi:hypothetical protein IFT73_04100 [Aeromicrobium sp. CFBP 8757]|uniref:hypothetical protein n=1 Tax=Aeromicrobium sp. CFBP 8757 TaxID=2775288 RepID=UPI0017848D82|nr:hypothetical protein [Aeromicrobium sp. CFBP 8757]MBD8606026.1 hypothetical protein [Aeromicrobium sp. CFBP 8757]